LRDAANAARVVKCALARGLILLQSGSRGETITIAPPLVIDAAQLARATDILEEAITAQS